MRYTLIAKGLSLKIDDKMLEYMSSRALDAYPNEVGGMLAGRYESKNSTVVECIVMPKEISGTLNEFIRDTTGLEKLWVRLKNEGLEYLGEWHTHPNGSSNYSPADLTAMSEIAKDEYVSILNPILLILSLDSRRIKEHNVYLYDSSRLLMYQKATEQEPNSANSHNN